MTEQVIIRPGSFAERLAEVRVPLCDGVRRALTAVLESESRLVGQTVREERFREYAVAVHGESQARENFERASARCDAAESQPAAAKSSSVALTFSIGGLSLACFAACVYAEYVLNAAVVPWLLSISPRSWLAAVLSFAPAVAPIVLDRVFSALVDVEGPADANATSVLPKRARFSRAVVRAGFFISAGALTAWSIWLLADARGVASALRHGNAAEITVGQQVTIDDALRLLSLALTVNGALFYLFGVHEVRTAIAVRNERRRIERMRRERDGLRLALTTAATERQRREQAWNEIDRIERDAVDAYVTNGLARIDVLAAHPWPVRSARDIVAARLTLQSPPPIAL
jgi:hypothetical protein